MRNRLWLTYAWKDNELEGVDALIASLKGVGLEVGFDRAKLLAGHSIWQQIAHEISNERYDAWAIYATKNSLESPACREELDYALNEALAQNGNSFPLIGIFPEHIDRSNIPAPLRTRKYVVIGGRNWLTEIADGVAGRVSHVPSGQVQPIWHSYTPSTRVLEFGPRLEPFSYCFAMVPIFEFTQSTNISPYSNHLELSVGPRNSRIGRGMTMNGRAIESDDKAWNGVLVGMEVRSSQSAMLSVPNGVSSIVIGGAVSSGQVVSYKVDLLL